MLCKGILLLEVVVGVLGVERRFWGGLGLLGFFFFELYRGFGYYYVGVELGSGVLDFFLREYLVVRVDDGRLIFGRSFWGIGGIRREGNVSWFLCWRGYRGFFILGVGVGGV